MSAYSISEIIHNLEKVPTEFHRSFVNILLAITNEMVHSAKTSLREQRAAHSKDHTLAKGESTKQYKRPPFVPVSVKKEEILDPELAEPNDNTPRFTR
jgi:hypothetical protein